MHCAAAHGRFSDALKRLREALVDKPRVSATWVVAQGVGGLQRALLMVAKVREPAKQCRCLVLQH